MAHISAYPAKPQTVGQLVSEAAGRTLELLGAQPQSGLPRAWSRWRGRRAGHGSLRARGALWTRFRVTAKIHDWTGNPSA
ncbi:MAG TPA: hypothetical protein VN520_30205 [Streptomyces sp.]|uniref:hypothetical protein n=1 Tax=Streptomyces sp. TaxID=1931 RepID=UPI002C126EBF|nr:hypothetical protein [Streptomyces sp.]HWU10586.1 hypothetical protein [Streptomyces sp.]